MLYLSAADLLYIHSRIADSFGIQHGVQSLAVIKKTARYMHDTDMFPSLFDKAGALLFALLRKKPFTYANTPTAIVATATLLNINRHQLHLSQELLDGLLEGKKKTVAEYADLLKSHSSKNVAS